MPLSPLIRFGTSTWAYEGWQGLVYRKAYPKGRFKKDSLAEYTHFEYKGAPLFRTVGLDATFYRPATDHQLAQYAQQLPPGFDMCSKVWEELTIPQYPALERYGEKAGQSNARFLDARLFKELVLSPYRQVFKDHTGPFIFEFQRTGIEPENFLQRLDRFLGELPADFSYAVEVRNQRLLGPDYWSLLKAHAVSHVYNHWTYMPPIAEQHRKLSQEFTAPFVLFRLLTPLRIKYETAVRMAEPYNKINAPLPTMRVEAVTFVGQAVAENRRAYVLVNNRAEGCAPLTIQALADQLREGS